MNPSISVSVSERGVVGAGAVADVGACSAKLATEIAEEADPLATDDVQLDLYALTFEATQQIARFFDEVRVERASEPAIRREQQHRRALHLRRLPEQRKLLRKLRRVQIADHVS